MHIQKALDQMNLQVHRVLSDITGLSGLRILDAILAGQRDPVALANLCHSRVRSSRDIVAKSLDGDYRSEHALLFGNRWRDIVTIGDFIAEVDEEIQRHLAEFKTTANIDLKPPRTNQEKGLSATALRS